MAIKLYYGKIMCHDDLILGLATKTRAWKGVGHECNLGVCKNVREWAHTLSSGLPLWKLES
jgi:hypothetical protein